MITKSFKDKLHKRLSFIYKTTFDETLLNAAVEKIEAYLPAIPLKQKGWSASDIILITYGDSVKEKNTEPLKTLYKFCKTELQCRPTVVHILPFFPYSSDDGFSVIDYYKVRKDLGNWEDITTMQQDFELMADLVINHNSTQSQWFRQFLNDELPGKNYYITGHPSQDVSKVVRPRSTPLLTAFETKAGIRHVWTTFSDDQADLNFANPALFLEMLDILLFYLSKGIRVIRLDAIAFLWKQHGTSCLHLPETHEFVKLFRDIFDFISPHLVLLTETNVPNRENMSYFGSGDEAHMIYQFSMPPLLLHAFFSENARYFNSWASQLPEPPEKATYFNFTASHDGIGVRPLEGILGEEEKEKLFRKMKSLGGMISTKTNSDGTTGPYEMNITYFDALRETNISDAKFHHARFISSQMVMAAFKGVPAFYIHSLLATENDTEGYAATKRARSLNRKIWDYDVLKEKLNSNTHHRDILQQLIKTIHIRQSQPAFHPEAAQQWIDSGSSFITFLRYESEQQILHITNVTHQEQSLLVECVHASQELLSGKKFHAGKNLVLVKPFETLWLSGPAGAFSVNRT